MVLHTATLISAELFDYYTNPYILLRCLKLISSTNRRIRLIWVVNRGRRPISEQTRALIIELKTLNPTWGGQRISDELKKISIAVSKRTVLKILREEGLSFPPPHRNLKWSEFLQNHNFMIGIDFTCIFSLFGKQLFILVGDITKSCGSAGGRLLIRLS